MKKQFLFIALLGTASYSQAQSVPNGGFENWNNQTTYEDPQNWTSMNVLSMFGAEATAIKSTQAHSGNYALKLTTSVSDLGSDGEMDTIAGVLILGTSDFLNGTGAEGYPFTQRPDSLTGWYKLTSPDDVPFQLEFFSSKWNATNQNYETIGDASFSGEASSTYIRFSVPIDYSSNATPDSIRFFIVNANTNTSVTNELYLDDLAFVYNTSTAGLEEQTAQVRMYPNPVTNQLFIQSEEPIQHLSVLDVQGKSLFEQRGNTGTNQVETGNFTPGIYFCEVSFSNGTSKRLKFVKN